MSRDRLAELKDLLHEARVCLEFENVLDTVDYLHQAEKLIDSYLKSLTRIGPLIRGPQLKLGLA